MDIDLEELASIIELLDKADFRYFSFEKGDLRITVSRDPLDAETPHAPTPHAPTIHAPTIHAPATHARATQAPPANAQPDPPQSAAIERTDAADSSEVIVTAPLLGTFYRSPKPGEPPFAEVGEKIDADSVLCIVEVMKLMNSVPAGVAGELTRVLATDGELVEFGQPLFAIRPLP